MPAKKGRGALLEFPARGTVLAPLLVPDDLRKGIQLIATAICYSEQSVLRLMLEESIRITTASWRA